MNILDVCATRTLDCGVVPIELGVRAMYDCYSSRVAGYRIRAYINSILYGSLSPEDYFASIEHDAVGADFAKRNLRAVIKAAPGISGEAPEPEIISVQCPQAIFEGEDIYDILRAVGRGADAKIIKKMCLEFDGNLLCGDVRRLERIFAGLEDCRRRIRAEVISDGCPGGRSSRCRLYVGGDGCNAFGQGKSRFRAGVHTLCDGSRDKGCRRGRDG